MRRRKKVTMGDIAERVGVSVVTVSKALNNKDGVGPTLRQQIITTAQDLGYVLPSSLEGELLEPFVSGKATNMNIGILVGKSFFQNSSSFYFNLYQLVVGELTNRGHFGIVEIVDLRDMEIAKQPRFITQQHVQGIIVLGQFPTSYLRMLEASRTPMIFIDFSDPLIEGDAILQDNVVAAYRATEYLIKQGHERISYVGSILRTSSIMERYLGYHQSMLAHGFKDFEVVIEDRDKHGIYLDIELPDPLPTALLCNSDEAAYELMNQLKIKGYQVPRDISIFAFDNTIYSTMTKPHLTTISGDVSAMAKFAVSDLLLKIDKLSKNLGWLQVRKIVSMNINLRDSVKKI